MFTLKAFCGCHYLIFKRYLLLTAIRCIRNWAFKKNLVVTFYGIIFRVVIIYTQVRSNSVSSHFFTILSHQHLLFILFIYFKSPYLNWLLMHTFSHCDVNIQSNLESSYIMHISIFKFNFGGQSPMAYTRQYGIWEFLTFWRMHCI